MKIWKKVLGRSRIGINDNFFDVGGTSLKAVQVVAMLKKELKRDLSIVSLFEYPTVSLLAAKLSSASGESDSRKKTADAAQRG
jgi:acyl carrier protein